MTPLYDNIHIDMFLITDVNIPRDIVLEAIKSMQHNLTQRLSQCCNATLDDVFPALIVDLPADVVVDLPTNYAPGGIPLWVVTAMTFGGFAIIFFIVIVLVTRFR